MPITEEFVKHLMEQNKVMAEQISQLTKTVENLNQTIQKLQEQLNASHQAKKTGGGQEGHEGKYPPRD
ncbi:MAG: hypothetical protein E7399_10105 [Ruminococcaceae bacterium]|nr:hypothetical protein [Oscillospiraceae bacterium]